MKTKAIIISIEGFKLTSKEKLLLSNEKPWGIILFKRNINSFHQIKNLIMNIKKYAKNKRFPILIDEEGLKVSRLKNIFTHKIDANYFGNLYKKDKKITINLYKTYLKSLCNTLRKIGFNINTIPVLDVLRKNTNKVIGNRSFSKDKKIVKELGELTVKECHAHNIISVIKHIPGHGCSTVDSHFKMPIVKLSRKKLNEKDFYPFKSTSAKLAMTAHILYSKIDSKNVSTFSKKVIKNIIRKQLGYKGILMSDDISMKSLKFGLVDNVTKALDAGCNLILHCNGRLNEMKKISKVIPKIDKFTQKKTSDFYNFLG